MDMESDSTVLLHCFSMDMESDSTYLTDNITKCIFCVVKILSSAPANADWTISILRLLVKAELAMSNRRAVFSTKSIYWTPMYMQGCNKAGQCVHE